MQREQDRAPGEAAAHEGQTPRGAPGRSEDGREELGQARGGHASKTRRRAPSPGWRQLAVDDAVAGVVDVDDEPPEESEPLEDELPEDEELADELLDSLLRESLR